MHVKFEIKLIVKEILGKPPKSSIQGIGYIVRKYYLTKYLNEYYLHHKELPFGSHDLGRTKIYNLIIGVIDFDALRHQIYEDLKRKDDHNYKQWIEGSGISNFQMSREFIVGFKEQSIGNNPNELIFNMRQRIASRERFSLPI